VSLFYLLCDGTGGQAMRAQLLGLLQCIGRQRRPWSQAQLRRRGAHCSQATRFRCLRKTSGVIRRGSHSTVECSGNFLLPASALGKSTTYHSSTA
jgi:hypothetical protein